MTTLQISFVQSCNIAIEVHEASTGLPYVPNFVQHHTKKWCDVPFDSVCTEVFSLEALLLGV